MESYIKKIKRSPAISKIFYVSTLSDANNYNSRDIISMRCLILTRDLNHLPLDNVIHEFL